MNLPISMSSTYIHDAALEYGRDGSASYGALEAALGALDGGRAVTFATGLAAATAIADLVPAGGTVVLSTVTYYGVRTIFERLESAGRLRVRLAPADDTDAVLAAADGADMVWVESIANPLMVVADVPAIAAGARERGALTVVDATFATPLRQRPLELGADIVLHSATKFIAGHSDLLLGAAVCRDEAHADALAAYRHDHGAIPGALETFLALRGLRTLAGPARPGRGVGRGAGPPTRRAPARVRRPLPGTARRLGSTSAPARVLPDGCGPMLSFEVAGTVEQTEAFLARLQLIDPRDEPRRCRVADRASGPLRRRCADCRAHPLPSLGRPRGRRGPLGRPRRGAPRSRPELTPEGTPCSRSPSSSGPARTTTSSAAWTRPPRRSLRPPRAFSARRPGGPTTGRSATPCTTGRTSPALSDFAQAVPHREAKASYDRWYDAYQVVVAEVRAGTATAACRITAPIATIRRPDGGAPG